MGPLGTRIVVGVVALVLALALLDSLRGGNQADESQPAPTTDTARGVESRIAIANRLRHERIGGRLVYADERCVLRAVRLPDLASVPAPGGRRTSCGFALSPDGRRVATSGAEWSADSRRVAVCRGIEVAVAVGSELSRPTRLLDGCAPAWRPGGGLTVARADEVVAESGRRILSVRALEAAARAHPFAPEGPQLGVDVTVIDLAWLTRERLAVLTRIFFTSAGRELDAQLQVAVFERGRLVGTEAAVGEVWTKMGASRGFLALRPGWLLDSTARRVYPLPGVPSAGADAVAVSPNRRWVAVALRGRITLLSIAQLRAGRLRSVRLQLTARDLAWR